MIDFGFDKIALIGAVALIVIGPEKLPRVARTVGALMGKARRYVADVKAEVNRSIELEELQKAKAQFESAARGMHDSVAEEFRAVGDGLQQAADGALSHDPSAALGDGLSGGFSDAWSVPPPEYRPPRKKWRLKRGALPRWYKQQQGLRLHVQSGAARVARHRPQRTFR